MAVNAPARDSRGRTSRSSNDGRPFEQLSRNVFTAERLVKASLRYRYPEGRGGFANVPAGRDGCSARRWMATFEASLDRPCLSEVGDPSSRRSSNENGSTKRL